MIEELISFETAKLAKEKGFDIPTTDYFMGSGKSYSGYKDNHNKEGITKEKYSKPTQALLQKWLREKHDIHIAIEPYTNGRFEATIYTDLVTEEYNDGLGSSETYEQALEVGLQESLKRIKL